MKKLSYFLSISALAIFALVVLFPACEGPEGPAGKDGLNGMDGKDVNAFCVTCHNEANFSAVEAQFETSLHSEGHTWAGGYGSRQGCTRCHSYQGYKETMLTGKDTVASVPLLSVALQCDACHDFHGTLDSVDFPNYALGHAGAARKLVDNSTNLVDFNSSSNVCYYCHQARGDAAFPLPATGDQTYAITNARWGPHHGTQGNLFDGTDGWEYPGSAAYAKTNHKGVTTCSGCHMAEGEGIETGGHTWRIKNEDGSKVNLNGCKACHTDITTTDYKGVQTEIAGLLGQLKTKLIAAKLLNEATDLAWPYNNASGKGSEWSLKEAGAFFNYKMVEEDRSMGVHNYKYIKALLVNSLEALN